MKTEGEVMALFAKANPVSSLDLLEPIEAIELDHLIRSDRSSEMTEVQTDETKSEGTGRKPRVALVVAMAVVAVAAVGILVNNESEVASTESIGNAFMNAYADHDGEAALELMAEDGRYLGLSPLSNLPLALDLDGALGENITNKGCEVISTDSSGTFVDCPFIFEGDVLRALGVEPASVTYTIRVDEGQIQSVDRTCCEDVPGQGDTWGAFRDWVKENHPDDFETMYIGEGGAHLNPESIALFEQYTDEFVAVHAG